jgi:hypothetical protein
MRLPKFPHLTRLPLALEITLAVLLKIAILAILWKISFSVPQTKKMTMPAPQVEQHLLAAPAASISQPQSSLPSKARDDPAR